MIGEVCFEFVDKRPGGVCFADRNAVEPNHFAVVVFKFGIFAEPLPEARRVLLPPQ